MKVLSRRAKVMLVFSLVVVSGLLFFTARYINRAPAWAQYPTNRHFFKDGRLILSGTIYDRTGKPLLQTEEGTIKFNSNQLVRTAMMHATGDLYGNVVTGAQVVFGERLTGWDFLNGAYHFNKQAGNNLTLTLDAGLCAEAYSALNGRKGTVGVYNYQTGELLCMVSSPSFDPQNPPDVAKNPEKYEGVYINRLLSASYTPGSVFKLVTASAAIDLLKDIDQTVYHCDGALDIGGDKVTCPEAHGDVTLEKALAKSCNVAFAEITLKLGKENLQNYADKAGLNASLDVDGMKTAKGVVKLTDAQGANLAWAGIGQYSDMVNPLNFMAFVGAIANDGVRVSPSIVLEKGAFSGMAYSVGGSKRILSAGTAKTLGEMMRNNVVSEYGESNYSGLELCAKTGTAEVGKDKRPHSWFVGYMDREDFPLAFVVVVENGGSGGKVAGPVAARVLRAAVKNAVK